MGHPSGHDYEAGSPHPKHGSIRARINESLRATIKSIFDRKGTCRVLEVGAGHGTFTDIILGAGAKVTVTEMSLHSAQLLRDRYERNSNVQVVYDQGGTWLEQSDDDFDLIACLSVLHHIPDYGGFLVTAFERTAESGVFISWQDPKWYPGQSSWNRGVEKASYFAWRLVQGDLRRGLSTRFRRVRGVYDEANPADMVEYHVVRDGVRQDDIMRLGQAYFDQVELITYWSTQSRFFQYLGEKTSLNTTFGLKFEGRKAWEIYNVSS